MRVVLTGGRRDVALTRFVARGMPAHVFDRGGATNFDAMAELLGRADAVVVGNTGPAHVAAAMGTPVVSVFAPTVPPERWRPWMVPHVLLGDQSISCRGCRARACPFRGQPCLAQITPSDVVAAVTALVSATAVVA
jgi:ADP-heptose:LPS heptosyltransferase